jgi:hypothetical protein
MKKLIYFTPMFFILSVYMTCKKDAVVQQPAQTIVGTWQLVAQKGGFTGGNLPIPNYVITYTFNADSTFQTNPAQRSGKFHITTQQSIFTGNMQPFLILSSGYDVSGLVDVKKDSLIISDNHVESVSSIYVRVK